MARVRGILPGLAALFLTQAAFARERVEVLVPDRDNLQHMAFWVAKQRFFAEEGLEVQTTVPEYPRAALEALRRGDAEVAVLPPPMYLQLIAERVPIVLVANLLANDPIELVVRRSVVAERKIPTSGPVAARLRELSGLRVGVAPNPPARLRALFASQGLNADRDIQMVILRGPDQNAAFAAGRVDALYAHTPYVETALVEQDAVLVINQSAGEVPELANRQIHALVVTRALAERDAERVERLVRAIEHALSLIRAEPGAAVEILLREFPALSRPKLETIVGLYAKAMPHTAAVSVEGLKRAHALFPAAHAAPSLEGIDLDAFIDARFTRPEPRELEARSTPAWGFGALGAVFVVLLGFAALRRKLGAASSASGRVRS